MFLYGVCPERWGLQCGPMGLEYNIPVDHPFHSLRYKVFPQEHDICMAELFHRQAFNVISSASYQQGHSMLWCGVCCDDLVVILFHFVALTTLLPPG